MDKEQEELQFLGFIGIFKESTKIISSWRKIFTEISLALVLPLSVIFLAHLEISELLFARIIYNENELEQTQKGTSKRATLSDMISSEWTAFWLFKIAYFIFFLILSLLSTSAVVYTIACIYTSKDTIFKKVMRVVPKVWKRLMVTFIWGFLIVFIYNIFASLVLMVIWNNFVGSRSKILFLLIPIYFMGFVYITVVWHLASVVSVVEDDYGIQAMIKSKTLINGKTKEAIGIFLLLTLCFIGIQVAYERLVVLGESVWLKVAVGILCFNLLATLIVVGLVIQTVIYFVCKSYHHENIDKLSLADHLEGYLGDYVPLISKDVQLEELSVV